MPPLRRYYGFISHAWNYNDEYYRLEKRLDDYANFDFYNYSVPEHDPIVMGTRNSKNLSTAIRNQMRSAQIVLIIAGMYVAYSEWIQFEIDYAVSTSKPIIGINPWGSEVTPTAVSSVAVKMVGWNTPNIVQAIRDYALKPA